MYRAEVFASVCVMLVVLGAPAAATAQVPSGGAFIPVVRGGPSDVEKPEKVSVKEDVVTAATPQDAINAAVEKNVKDLGGSSIEEVGATIVRFPSGIGFVGTDMATYATMSNPTATRIAKRKAYVIAFVKAKKNLAEILGGLKNEGRESIREELLRNVLPDQEMTNAATVSEEVLRQTVDMMLRGFVVYEVKDNVDEGAVYVSIVTTPKTRSHVHRPATNAVLASDLEEGINQVLDEVRSGVVPPVGGRIVGVPSAGQTAFVGFGSAIVGISSNKALQAKNNYAAKTIAGMRSKDALCGLIEGDRTTWEGSVTEKLKHDVREFQEFQTPPPDDPFAFDAKKMDQPCETFRSTEVFRELSGSARNGILPPGVITKTWFDDDHAWAWGVSVFWAPVTVLAEGAAADMKRGPLYDGTPQSPFTGPSKEPSRPGGDVRRGPDGTVTPKKDL
ncbi:MAG TPA: hypothetical protein VMY37_04750 [Thermoguttaceae bacterium]|nr:hypothetical protein [Thermoguttaceae bacterium]